MTSTPATIPELVNLITDSLLDDPQILKVSSRINRTFYLACSRHMFRSITLCSQTADERSSSISQRFVNLVESSPHIADLVQELHVNLDELRNYTDPYLPRAIGLLPSISVLKLNQLGLRYGVWDAFSVALQSSLIAAFRTPSVTEVQLKNIRNVPPSLLRSFRAARNVSLIFIAVEVETSSTVQDSTSGIARPQLDVLTFIHPELSSVSFRPFVLDPPFDLTRLKTFNIMTTLSSDIADEVILWDMLQSARIHLEHLAFRSYTSLPILIGPMNLGRLTALRSLLFVFPISYRSPLPWLNQHLGRLHGLNNLEEITMNFYFRPTSKQNIENFASTSRDDWKTMDSAISLASLHSIRKINIEFVTGDDHWDLETVKTTVIESMRRLDIIGILDVKDVRAIRPQVDYL